jgi:hypothetical protein
MDELMRKDNFSEVFSLLDVTDGDDDWERQRDERRARAHMIYAYDLFNKGGHLCEPQCPRPRALSRLSPPQATTRPPCASSR